MRVATPIPTPSTTSGGVRPSAAAATSPVDDDRRGDRGAFGRILVAVDASEQAEFAADVAANYAGRLDADVVLVHVFGVDAGLTPELAHLRPDLRAARVEAGEALLDRVAARMPPGLGVEKVLREGGAADEIVAAADSLGADLIVMGTHGRGRLVQALVGSVARAVAGRAACPVLTVTHPPGARAAGARATAGGRDGGTRN